MFVRFSVQKVCCSSVALWHFALLWHIDQSHRQRDELKCLAKVTLPLSTLWPNFPKVECNKCVILLPPFDRGSFQPKIHNRWKIAKNSDSWKLVLILNVKLCDDFECLAMWGQLSCEVHVSLSRIHMRRRWRRTCSPSLRWKYLWFSDCLKSCLWAERCFFLCRV